VAETVRIQTTDSVVTVLTLLIAGVYLGPQWGGAINQAPPASPTGRHSFAR